MKNAPRFDRTVDQDFSRQLRKRVNAYFEENHLDRTGDWKVALKTISMLAMYFGPYALMVTMNLTAWQYVLCAAIMGVGVAGIGLAIMHDSCHGSFSKKRWVNTMMGYSLNVIGGNALNWKIQHNVLHHSFTNVHGVDEDLEGGDIMRFTPNEPWKPRHQLQHIYSWFLYSLMTVSRVTLKDFKRLSAYNSRGLVEAQGAKYGSEMAILVVSKIVYYGYMIVTPLMLGYNPILVVAAFLMMHMIGGLLLAMIFQPAHIMEEHEFIQGDTSVISSSYEGHQLKTTANFAPTNKLLTWYCGGLNYQVEHHIFPNISHIHYPAISKIVKATAQEFGLPYRSAGSFREALQIHQRTMKNLGRKPV
ncbi:MAG: acyl-CoA desaturase [Flavobacteriales bacterium]|nr:acyl-CoA desaturase [Flavobacteriales bacterium]